MDIGFTFNFDAHPVPQSQQPVAQFNAVTADYFKAMRVPLRKGRWFTERDDKNAPPVAIVTGFCEAVFSRRRSDRQADRSRRLGRAWQTSRPRNHRRGG